MQSLGLLSLIVVLAICYLLFFGSQSPHSAAPGQAASAAPVHDVYKADMDQAHAAAQLMVKSHKESDAY
jgi:hypothetical protein